MLLQYLPSVVFVTKKLVKKSETSLLVGVFFFSVCGSLSRYLQPRESRTEVKDRGGAWVPR